MPSRWTTRIAGFVCLVFPSLVSAQAPTMKTAEFTSDSVGRTLKYNVVLPARYSQGSERYPVLYLLHGYSGNFTAWARHGIAEAAKAYDLIVVMPDAGNSWYVNWAASDDGQKNRWEDAIAKDLVSHVDATYRTIARREGRAINGLSMGGFGGLLVGLKNPDLFCSAGSHSGALAFARQAGERMKNGPLPQQQRQNLSTKADPRVTTPGFSSQDERSPRGRVFATVEDCAANDPFAIVLKIPREKLPHIYVDCGTEDRLLDASRAFLKHCTENKVPITYAESGGGHTGAYWAREIGHSMAVQYAIIRRSLAAMK